MLSKPSILKFVDLFCGIGSFHLALESLGLKCVFSSDIDDVACSTYEANFGKRPYGDITKIEAKEIPEHDVICAGYPCQPFSISGKGKGFEDLARGTLFYEIIRIAEYHRPKILFLENVANFEVHDKGRSINIVKAEIDRIGYDLHYAVLNASYYGFATARERIYMVAFRRDLGVKSFSFPKPTMKAVRLLDFIDPEVDTEMLRIKRTDFKPSKKDFGLIEGLDLFDDSVFNPAPIRIGHVNYGGQGDRVYSPMGPAITFSASGGGNGSKTGAYLINGVIRRLSPREALSIMGFPKSFILKGTPNQQYHQIGNSVVVGMIKEIFLKVIDQLAVS